ncbi:ABC transporter ATP-binding protein [Isoptericola sp. b441]|uniref:ABC transporter ATP-binding protein n=1 Tax=Actinotalea lenta TaxID=3064654 RepID=A0ABT9D785_9CELL|nr:MULTISPECIES: ABC transporter ATP-binding protein [unclassified Isoptericola]MDO8106281.1 ABC transporter ATP-binding protein [Isoptericola sp. b441]MDO8121999.1 ABC transporter ATP-binding protein [Isoptericola sp. b490]
MGVRDLVVLYRDDDGSVATAVDHLDLDVATGEVVALLGPSGSGKSSLLRAVAGLEPAASGRIGWDGVDLAGVPTHRRGFGLMFQDGQLFGHRDVAGNVAFGLQMQRMPARERATRVSELLGLVGLGGFEHRAISTLSGGERQRVALARSLAPGPRLLLLDEPLSALDRALRERLADDVRAALLATGTTALFVTHDHDEAFAVADRIAVMDAGRLLQVDAPALLWQAPATRRVAEFLGYEAFAPVDAPVAAVLGSGLAVPVGTVAGRSWSDGTSDAVLAVGPGSLETAADGPLAGEVRSAGFRRGVIELGVVVEGLGAVTVVERSAGRTGAADLPRAGTTVRLRPVVGGVARIG